MEHPISAQAQGAGSEPSAQVIESTSALLRHAVFAVLRDAARPMTVLIFLWRRVTGYTKLAELHLIANA